MTAPSLPAVIAELEKALARYNDAAPEEEDQDHWFDMVAVSSIKHLPALLAAAKEAERMRERAVADELPPDGQWVFVRKVKSVDVMRVRLLYSELGCDLEWVTTTGHTNIINPGSVFTPTYWSPLPSPPEEGK